jgi:hypothetical protein
MLRSNLARLTVSGYGPDDETRRANMLAAAWHNHGIMVIRTDDPHLTWPEREFVRQLGAKRYGKRRSRNGETA